MNYCSAHQLSLTKNLGKKERVVFGFSIPDAGSERAARQLRMGLGKRVKFLVRPEPESTPFFVMDDCQGKDPFGFVIDFQQSFQNELMHLASQKCLNLTSHSNQVVTLLLVKGGDGITPVKKSILGLMVMKGLATPLLCHIIVEEVIFLSHSL